VKNAIVWILAGLVLIAAGEGEKKPVERNGIRVWPAVTDAFRNKAPVPIWTAPAAKPGEATFVEVFLAADESVWCGGVSVNLVDLRKMLAAHAGTARDATHPLNPSTVPVLIHAAKSVRWRILEFVMMCAAMPENRMNRIYLSLRDGEGVPVFVPCFLPVVDVVGGVRTGPVTVPIVLSRGNGEKHTRVKLLDVELGEDQAGFLIAAQRIKQIKGAGQYFVGVIHASPHVRYADVVSAYSAFRAAEVETVDFFGTHRLGTLVDPNLDRKLDESPEVPLPGAAELGKIAKLLPPVQRGPVAVWPAAHPVLRKKTRVPDWPGPANTPAEEELLEILVAKDGRLTLGGKEVDIRQLTMKLLVWAERSRDLEHPFQPSHMPIVIHASRDARWQQLQWTMQAAADPDVRIWRIYFATRMRDGKFAYVPVFLPTHRGGGSGGMDVGGLPPRGRKRVEVELKRKRDDTVTRLKFSGRDFGRGDTGFYLLRTYLDRFLRDSADPLYGRINAWAATPFQDVVNAIAVYRAAGMGELTFVGAPPPGKRK